MKPRHVTQHGTRRRGDALDLMVEQGNVLQALFAEWGATGAHPEDPERAVPANWDRGTIGKLVLEHAAVWLAAREDIVRVLHNIGRDPLADRLAESSLHARGLLDRLHDASAGVQPLALAVSPGFAEVMDEFHSSLGDQLGGEAGVLHDEIARALGDRRGQLRGGKYLRKHAPTHPGRRSALKRIPPITRLHAIYDRARGMPWAESYPQANTKLAARYDRNRT